MSRLLLIAPGHSFSTKDVYDGLLAAFRRAGHDLYQYDLNGRANLAERFLSYAYRQAVREGRTVPKPNTMDVLTWAGMGILDRALRIDADLTLFVSGYLVAPDVLELLRRAGKPTGIILTEGPYEPAEARLADLATISWTNERTAVSRFARCHYLPAAFDPEKHRPDVPLDPSVPAHDVVFVGSGFPERVKLLSAVDWDGLGVDLGLYGHWSGLGSRSRLRRYVRGGVVDNATAAALYRRAAIGLNLYRDPPDGLPAESLNPRAVELAACGAFTISQARAEVTDTFGPLVPAFVTPAELERLIRRWLPDTAGRQAISRQLPAAVEGRSFDRNVQRIIADWQRMPAAALRIA